MIITKNFSSVTLKKSRENTTGLIGLSWISNCMQHFGLKQIVEKRFPKGNSNRAIPAWNKIISGTSMLIAGGEKIEDIEKIKSDKALVNSMGMVNMISPDTYINFLNLIDTTKRTNKVIDDIAIKAMKKSELKEFTFDSDATFFDSDKNCAEWSYLESRQMNAMLGFIPELSGLCVAADYRSGNVSPSKGIMEQLKHTRWLALQAGKRVTRFRHDSASHNMEIFKYCDKHKIKFFVTIVKNSEVLATAKGIKEEKWTDLEGSRDKQYAEITYCQMKSKKDKITYRLLVLRWPNPKPDLYEGNYCYHVIATNDWNIESMEWLDFHNGRMNSENYNKEIKTGFSLNYTPSHSFRKNENYFLIGIIAYNMIQIMKLFYFDNMAEKWTIKTIRYWFINICGKITRSARKLTCKIINATDDSFRLFKCCQTKLMWPT